MKLLKVIEIIIMAIVAFLAPIQGSLYAVLGLVLVDLITGILVSRKNGMPINSKGIRATVLKLLVYELTLVLAYVVEVYLTGGFIPVLRICSTIVGMAELKSCYENLDLLTNVGLLRSIVNALQARVSNDDSQK